MDFIIGLLNNFTTDATQLRIAVILLSSLTVLALTMGLGFLLLGAIDPVRLRLNRMKHSTDTSSRMPGDKRESLSQHFIPASQWQNSTTLMRLANAGFRSESAQADYYAIRILSALLFPVITLFIVQSFPELTTEYTLYLLLATLAFGIILPSAILDRLIISRKRKLRHGFPDALDMLVVCVESGLGLQSALQRVAEELSISHPELAEELGLVNTEIRMGVERMQALRNMAYRTGLEDIRGLVTSLDQSMRFGTSIADTLRVYSEEFRDKRLQKAEEMAAKISTKMIFPLTFCLWPSFFLVMVGPAILGVLKVLSQT
ncbi:type II secretion system F family protein [Amphritea balenae]|uniref:Type II secretion system F family protein n=1 Tax=Amphritea balenae TaxID=452629 RepID=A0A3P1SW40_9GAMM|nr:type II secretion system F family protein [Amphritea balenae]RRD01185.1 type II secretion system F family protein [Amphritea balenae]GGK59219.1 pilus assembly protein TadC [Amphritea balenae]